MSLFGKRDYTFVKVKRKEMPDGLWTKCPDCGAPSYTKELQENTQLCPKCNYHMNLTSEDRIKLLFDEGTFVELDDHLLSSDPLEFKGLKTYKDKLESDTKLTGLKEAIVTGYGDINGAKAGFAVTDSRFIMGSMGSVVGERITRAIEHATKNKWPMIIVSGSGGGARMYEGALSLMQMAKTCSALARHSQARLLYISVLTNPTMAGIMASFAGVGDVMMAEPKALIGFTGRRVIEQTIRQKLPADFQTSEFLLEHGLIDMIINRKEMKERISSLIDYSTLGKS